MTEKGRKAAKMNLPPEDLVGYALFRTGRCYATPGAMEVLMAFAGEYDEWGREGARLLDRHRWGDWGDLCADDKQANEDALNHGARILSHYVTPGGRLYVITEADRSSTTILRPEEY